MHKTGSKGNFSERPTSRGRYKTVTKENVNCNNDNSNNIKEVINNNKNNNYIWILVLNIWCL